MGRSDLRLDFATILALGAAGLLLTVAFLVREHYATEPILPLALFRNPVFTVANSVTFIVGVSMFGAIIYRPLYLQVVKGNSPTVPGLLLLPLMAGILAASIGSGRIISRIGRLKVFPYHRHRPDDDQPGAAQPTAGRHLSMGDLR